MELNKFLTSIQEEFDLQIRHYQKLIDEFQFTDRTAAYEKREQFFDLASYVDKLNENLCNKNKLEAIIRFSKEEVLLSVQKHHFRTTLTSREFVEKTLSEYYAISGLN